MTNDEVHDEPRYEGPDYVKLSPTRIITALACPRKYRYRYVDGLEPRKLPSILAFGRAVHAAIAAAYAHQNAPLKAEEIARFFALHFTAQDNQGISYKERESLEDLLEKGKALVTLWWSTYRDDVLASKVVSLEAELSHDVDVGFAVHGHPDVIEERDGLWYVGEHKTCASWGESDEILVARSVQLTMYAYLCQKVHGRLPDKLYVTVLKKTKEPRVFRYYTTRTATEVDAFEDYIRGVAELVRFYREKSVYPKNYSRDCSWCGFNELCWGIEGAEGRFKKRESSRTSEREKVEV